MSDNASLARLASQIDALTAQVADLQSQLAAAGAQTNALTAERDAIKAELAKAKNVTAVEGDAHRNALSVATQAVAAANAERDKAKADYVALSSRVEEAPSPASALVARVAELEALLAEPPADSGITVVQYLGEDGKVERRRYRCSDGAKFRLLPDALLHKARLALVEIGLTEVQADAVLVNRDRVLQQQLQTIPVVGAASKS